MDEVTAVCAAVLAAVTAALTPFDGRSNRGPIENNFVVPNNTWLLVKSTTSLNAWFTRHLRCPRPTFNRIVDSIGTAWPTVHPALHHLNRFGIDDRVACTLHYLTHSDGYESTAALFGISKTRAYEYCNQVFAVVQLCFVLDTISMPTTHAQWEDIRTGIEAYGFPNAYDAIDGIRTTRRSLTTRCLEKRATKESLGPGGGCFLGDAGYKLYSHLMTPYTIYSDIPQDEAHYNTIHSRSRMVVERAFGLWKNKFRVFKAELLQHRPSDMARLIEVSLVFHNWFIEFNEELDNFEPEFFPEWMHTGGDTVFDEELNQVDGAPAKRARDMIKLYLSQHVSI
ncbi:hypothetical protein H257_18758 [Aphanomyces astaci]|uniref:DDE Tnp4 domain-containing protein n=1 Tax=Aphanomyces astaci TaxID=112090 RepID=W4FBP6_APHAT|nr:hypothetical protein H257_18758 [Aphanomyces astaci]ETV64339.1 hypothetical protein H257_18758 [Aphanomyces astaci]|eukprot:XP_009846181.1 hypothetical protein H257_18758 [Aphanomyces astaci]